MSRHDEGEGDDSVLLSKEPCPACRENGGDWDGDNLARYSDGHGYCFACGHYEKGDGATSNTRKKGGGIASTSLLPHGEIQRLGKRGISEETCRKFGYNVLRLSDDSCRKLGYPAGTVVQVSPHYNAAGELTAQHTRDANKEFRWVGNRKAALLFGQHLWNGGGRRVIITEGEIDCLTVSQIQGNKWPVAAVTNGTKAAVDDIRRALEWLETFDEVVFCFDMDDVGRKAAQECAALITPGKAKIAFLPLKDANECLLNDKVKELTSALWNAKPYRPDGIRNIKDLKESSRASAPQGVPISYPELSGKILGIRGRELYLFTAGSGIGKSTIVHEIAYELHQTHGWPLGVLALEESNDKTVRRYVGIKLNKPLNLPGYKISDEEYDAGFDELAAREDIWFYDHFGSTDVDGILSKLRFMVVACGVKVVVLDHISIVVSGLDETAGESERKTIDKLMTRLRSLVEETGVCLLAVVHLKRPSVGKSWNEGREPSLTDLRGSASLEQLSDVVIALGRNQQGANPNVSEISVLKNRPVGLTGKAGMVEYIHETGRLIPSAGKSASPFTDESAHITQPTEVKGDY